MNCRNNICIFGIYSGEEDNQVYVPDHRYSEQDNHARCLIEARLCRKSYHHFLPSLSLSYSYFFVFIRSFGSSGQRVLGEVENSKDLRSQYIDAVRLKYPL